MGDTAPPQSSSPSRLEAFTIMVVTGLLISTVDAGAVDAAALEAVVYCVAASNSFRICMDNLIKGIMGFIIELVTATIVMMVKS